MLHIKCSQMNVLALLDFLEFYKFTSLFHVEEQMRDLIKKNDTIHLYVKLMFFPVNVTYCLHMCSHPNKRVVFWREMMAGRLGMT